MSEKVLLLSDKSDDLKDLKGHLAKYFLIEEIDFLEDDAKNLAACPVIFVWFELSNRDKISKFRTFCTKCKASSVPKIFLTDGSRQQAIQAANLGSKQTVARPVVKRRLHDAIAGSVASLRPYLSKEPSAALEVSQNTINYLLSISERVRQGDAVAKDDVTNAARDICSAVGNEGIMAWLQKVNLHHSYSYRHSLHVAGLMLAFGEHLKFNHRDRIRIAIGALMHDVGKMKIPLRILDKTTPLDESEKTIVRAHPAMGLQILERNNEWDPLTRDLVYQHHEMLDGSGFPNRLSGDQISDPVRMLTIADKFSDLVDKRSYKESRSPEGAMAVLFDMKDQLDLPLVRAFEPVGLSVATSVNELKKAA